MALTDKDLEKIDKRINKRIEERLEEFREKIQENNEKLFFKYKSELIDHIDPILKEVKDSREDRTVMAERISRHEDRLQKVETKLNIASV